MGITKEPQSLFVYVHVVVVTVVCRSVSVRNCLFICILYAWMYWAPNSMHLTHKCMHLFCANSIHPIQPPSQRNLHTEEAPKQVHHLLHWELTALNVIHLSTSALGLWTMDLVLVGNFQFKCPQHTEVWIGQWCINSFVKIDKGWLYCCCCRSITFCKIELIELKFQYSRAYSVLNPNPFERLCCVCICVCACERACLQMYVR